MTTTPDSINAADLEKALETAVKEPESAKATWQIRREANPDKPFNGMDIQEASDYVEYVIDQIIDEQPNVVIAKMIAARLIANVACQQQEVGEMLLEQNERSAGLAWIKDSGRLWAIQEQLRRIDVSDNDFIAEEDARDRAGYHGII